MADVRRAAREVPGRGRVPRRDRSVRPRRRFQLHEGSPAAARRRSSTSSGSTSTTAARTSSSPRRRPIRRRSSLRSTSSPTPLVAAGRARSSLFAPSCRADRPLRRGAAPARAASSTAPPTRRRSATSRAMPSSASTPTAPRYQKAEDAARARGRTSFGTLHWVGGVLQAQPIGLWFDVQASQDGSSARRAEEPLRPRRCLPRSRSTPGPTPSYRAPRPSRSSPFVDDAVGAQPGATRSAVRRPSSAAPGLSIKHDVYPVISGEVGLGLVPARQQLRAARSRSPSGTTRRRRRSSTASVASLAARWASTSTHPTLARPPRHAGRPRPRKTAKHTGESIYVGAFDGKLAISPSKEAVAGPAAGESLAEQSELSSMRKNTGMAKVTSFEFVNLRRYLSAAPRRAGCERPRSAPRAARLHDPRAGASARRRSADDRLGLGRSGGGGPCQRRLRLAP